LPIDKINVARKTGSLAVVVVKNTGGSKKGIIEKEKGVSYFDYFNLLDINLGKSINQLQSNQLTLL